MLDGISFVNNDGINTGNGTVSRCHNSTRLVRTTDTWSDQLHNLLEVYPSKKPVDNNYSISRNGHNDTVHVVVVDDKGTISGIQGNILEKFSNLSKARTFIDTDNPTKVLYKDYLALNSKYIYYGKNPSGGS